MTPRRSWLPWKNVWVSLYRREAREPQETILAIFGPRGDLSSIRENLDDCYGHVGQEFEVHEFKRVGIKRYRMTLQGLEEQP